MKKRGAYQKRKELINRVSRVAAVIVSVVIVFVFLAAVVQNICALREVEDGTLREYSGGYTYSLRKTRHNASYSFVLENGDKIVVNSRLLENKDAIELSSKLSFRYSNATGIIPWGGRICVSIESTDGSTVVLAEDVLKDDLTGRTIIYSILAVLIFTIALFQVCVWVLLNKKLIKRIFHR